MAGTHRRRPEGHLRRPHPGGGDLKKGQRPGQVGRAAVGGLLAAVFWRMRSESLRASIALLLLASLFGFWLSSTAKAADAPIQIGSKRFTESYILGEIITLTARKVAPAVHRQGLGNTAIVLQALLEGSIDVYPEYLGTIDAEILKNPKPTGLDAMRARLAKMGLGVGVPLGFVNSYALAMTSAESKRLGITKLSDLAAHPNLVMGLSNEFIGRADGWPGLATAYRLTQRPTGIDHGISYAALAAGRIAVTDIYTTDAKIAELGLVVLEDDRQYFPRYDAMLLYRLETPTKYPAAWKAIETLQGRIDQRRMITMNGQAELQGMSFADIAAEFVAPKSASGSASASASTAVPGRAGFMARMFDGDLGRLTYEHLFLVIVAVGSAALIGIPLGAAAAAIPRLEQPVMAVVGLLQTIPSLALFAMLIPLLGSIGTFPALVALSLYALLPIVRNTTTGLSGVSKNMKQAGTALGLKPFQRWTSIDLPLAAPVIVAGLKTATVITVGTATIAAFIGAGGYGERIATGLALNDNAALLAGAVPAAVMALVTQALFEVVERALVRRPASD